jgi:mannan endo-1,4-beta-mannosidase
VSHLGRTLTTALLFLLICVASTAEPAGAGAALGGRTPTSPAIPGVTGLRHPGTGPAPVAVLTDAPSVDSAAPMVSAISPSTVSAGGGATVTIIGSGFGATTAVYFGTNASSNFSVVSSTFINAAAPTNAGSVNVNVVTPAGTSANTQANRLTYVPTGQLPITASHRNLEVGGHPTKFTGVNAYELATSWGTNAGCGGMESPAQIAALFASLGPGSMVRFWAFQGGLATDVHTGAIDWAPIDQVFYLAAAYHVYLIPAITDQGGACDGDHWQNPSWYAGGYQDVFNSDASDPTPLSYWDYMRELVSRYKNSPALGMWEPISEPEASSCGTPYQPDNCSGHQTCPSESVAAADLISFLDVVGGAIHSIDPTHLVEEGLLGSGQCGTEGSDYARVGASPGIDVLSVHDYYGKDALGGDRYNGLALRFAQAAFLDKPIITAEVGIDAGTSPGCETLTQRATAMAAKKKAQFAAGSSAFLVWDWVLTPLGPCSDNTGPGDPLLHVLANRSSGT